MAKALVLSGASLASRKSANSFGLAGGTPLPGLAATQAGSIEVLDSGASPSLLGIGFLQQARPKLLVVERMHKEVLSVQDRQAIINHHFCPLATLPELEERWTYGSIASG